MEELCDQTVHGSEDKQNRQFSVIFENSMKQNNPLRCRVLEKIWRDVLRKCYFLFFFFFSGQGTGLERPISRPPLHRQLTIQGKKHAMLEILRRTRCLSSHPVRDKDDERFHFKVFWSGVRASPEITGSRLLIASMESNKSGSSSLPVIATPLCSTKKPVFVFLLPNLVQRFYFPVVKVLKGPQITYSEV